MTALPSPHATTPIPPIGDAHISDEAKYNLINREISWLAFNERVLAQAENPRHPLLERVRFLAVSASNLDEFMMVRVAGLKQQLARGIKGVEGSSAPPEAVLPVIAERIEALIKRQHMILHRLLAELSTEGIDIVTSDGLSASDRQFLRKVFDKDIFPIIAPVMIDPAQPFPFIGNRGFGLYLTLEDRGGAKSHALILLPNSLKRFIILPSEGDDLRLITLEDCVMACISTIFPQHRLVEHCTIRVLRDSELEFDEEAEDLVATFETALKARRHGDVIALYISAPPPQKNEEANEEANYATQGRDSIVELREAMGVDKESLILSGGMIGLDALEQLCNIGDDRLRFPPYKARFPERIRDFDGDCFAAIRTKDIIVHHPYESFDVVLQFLRQAAEDSQTVSIRQTLYRTLPDSPIVKALIAAAQSGKSVTAMVEIKARFDEEVNIRLARDLERAGVQTVYGFRALKTHAKLSLVIRKEGEGLKSYAHCGTGNYHPITAKLYTDLSFFTSDAVLCADITRIFNFMTSFVAPQSLNKMALAPVNIREMLEDNITAEIAAAKAGRPSGIWIKVNALVDRPMISRLYEASQAGVPIHIVARGICCLRPGVAGLSETIRVTSLIGRFLEHARIYVFAAGAELPSPKAKVYIASADLMHRNLNRRIEAMMPIENPTVHRQILHQVMQANINDTANSWLLQADGSYISLANEEMGEAFSAHHFFMTNPSLSGRGSALAQSEARGAMLGGEVRGR